MATVVMTMAVNATVAMAQVPDPSPDASMPGAGLVTSMLGWLKWGALAAAVGGILGGGVRSAGSGGAARIQPVLGQPRFAGRAGGGTDSTAITRRSLSSPQSD